jgi:hypothetical protein
MVASMPLEEVGGIVSTSCGTGGQVRAVGRAKIDGFAADWLTVPLLAHAVAQRAAAADKTHIAERKLITDPREFSCGSRPPAPKSGFIACGGCYFILFTNSGRGSTRSLNARIQAQLDEAA